MPGFLKKEILLSDKAIICYFVIINLIICLYPFHYGIFRDEFLYISLSGRPDWAFLEVPPIAPLVLAGVRFLLGISYFSLHLVPALLQSLVIIVSALMVKKMGGGLYATILCLLCVTLAPGFIGGDAHYDYNAFDRLFWTLTLYSVMLLIISGDKKYWLYFGLFAGLGLMSKVTMLYLGFSLLISFLALKDRKFLFDRRFLIGGLIAGVIFLPFIIWQIYYHFPIIEYFKGYAGKLSYPSPVQYILNQILAMNILAFPVWVSGLIYFLFNREGKRFRVFGLCYLILLALFISQNAKFYLIFPFYTVLFTGGAVLITGFFEKYNINWLKPALASLVFLGGVFFLPYCRPVLTPEAFIKYSGGHVGGNGEKFNSGSLPQDFADCFGWEQLARDVSAAYQKLSDPDKKRACILASNYGEAGALQFYGPKYGLPEPVCGHNLWYIWGPGNNTGDVMIIISPRRAEKSYAILFDSVEISEKTAVQYAMSYENDSAIFICRGMHWPLKSWWRYFKHFE